MSGSLLLIAVVWLVLLAPLLLRNRRPVRRTAQALNETRVLHSGDTDAEEGLNRRKRMPTLRKLRPANIAHQPSDDEDLELVEAEPEYIVFDDDGDSAPHRFRLGKFAAAVDRTNEADESDDEHAVASEETVTEDAAEPAADDVIEGEVVAEEAEESDKAEESETADALAGQSRPASHDETSTGEFPPVAVETEAEEAEEPETEEPQAVVDIPTAYLRGGDVDSSVVMDDEFEELQHTKEEDDYLYQELGESAEVTEEDMEYVNSRRGRGVFDPVASQRLVKQRQKRRAQVLTALVALTVVSGIAGVILDGAAWFVFAAMFLFTGIYLIALRRNAVEEARLRQRRLARMRRARLGVRNTADEELGVPDRLRRPSAVILEADDMDPEFQNLSYLDSRDFFDRDLDVAQDPYERHARAV